jgi:predicted HicB family RNase H-like nuclease
MGNNGDGGNRTRALCPTRRWSLTEQVFRTTVAKTAQRVRATEVRLLEGQAVPTVSCYHDIMTKNLTVRLDSELAADAEAIARADGTSLNETVKQALSEAVQRRRRDPKFKARLRRIIEEDRELLERLAK